MAKRKYGAKAAYQRKRRKRGEEKQKKKNHTKGEGAKWQYEKAQKASNQ